MSIGERDTVERVEVNFDRKNILFFVSKKKEFHASMANIISSKKNKTNGGHPNDTG